MLAEKSTFLCPPGSAANSICPNYDFFSSHFLLTLPIPLYACYTLREASISIHVWCEANLEVTVIHLIYLTRCPGINIQLQIMMNGNDNSRPGSLGFKK